MRRPAFAALVLPLLLLACQDQPKQPAPSAAPPAAPPTATEPVPTPPADTPTPGAPAKAARPAATPATSPVPTAPAQAAPAVLPAPKAAATAPAPAAATPAPTAAPAPAPAPTPAPTPAAGGTLPSPMPSLAANGHAALGPDKCRMCHRVQHDSWAATAHAKKGLDCEACHGNGADYKAMSVMKNPAAAKAAGLVVPTLDFCRKCHGAKADAALLRRAHAHKGA